MTMRFLFSLWGAALLAVAANAKIISRPVAYEHAGVQLEGWLTYDDSRTGHRPGVLVVHEWWGLNDYVKGRAQQLAEMGYVAFALDMYGKGVNTEDPKRAGELAGQFYGKPLMAERARAGLDQLLKTGLVNPKKVAAIGFCFGGATCQALAYSGAPLTGIVSFHGSLIPPPAGAPNQVQFLMLHGAADPFITAEEITAFTKGMHAGGFKWTWVNYPGAVHAFTNPNADRIKAAHPEMSGIGYNEAAATASWKEMQKFIHKLF
jgi:dienelactone hydrolase